MNEKVRSRQSRCRIARTLLLAIVLASCTSGGSTTAAPTDHNQSDDREPSSALALVDQPTLAVTAPLDGAIGRSPVRMIVATSGVDLAIPGSPVDGEGHWHVLIDQGCLPAGAFIPDDAQSIHVGSGSEAADIDLPPGTHELCVQIGDGFHVAVSVFDTITLTVVD